MKQIKQIELGDLEQCLFVINKSFLTVAKQFNLTQENCPLNPSFMKIETLQNRFNSGFLMFGLYENEELIGYVSLSIGEYNVVHLHNLAVLPEHRHKGYGKILLDFCKNKSKELCCNKIKIDIIEENITLKNWYLENGFIHLYTNKLDHLPFTIGFMEISF